MKKHVRVNELGDMNNSATRQDCTYLYSTAIGENINVARQIPWCWEKVQMIKRRTIIPLRRAQRTVLGVGILAFACSPLPMDR